MQLDNESEVALEKEDPLESLDPRKLPPLLFSTDEFSIGSRSYGSWRFTLNPNSEGASFTDLVFDFRGLRLGMDGPYVDGSEDNNLSILTEKKVRRNWEMAHL